jgi:hypothetical protein
MEDIEISNDAHNSHSEKKSISSSNNQGVHFPSITIQNGEPLNSAPDNGHWNIVNSLNSKDWNAHLHIYFLNIHESEII